MNEKDLQCSMTYCGTGKKSWRNERERKRVKVLNKECERAIEMVLFESQPPTLQ